MKIVRDRPDARWLPTRFNYALFRLFAYVMIRLRPRRQEPGIMLSVDRHQSALETHTVTAWIFLTASTYVFVFLSRGIHPVAAAALALPLTAVLFQVQLGIIAAILLIAGRKIPRDLQIRVQSFLAMAVLTALAAYLAGTTTPARYVAISFLAALALNAIAAPAAWLMRGRFAELERSFGVES